MKIKLKNLTLEQFKKWQKQNRCEGKLCEDCIFKAVNCVPDSEYSWIENKELFSEKFLEQEIEIEGPILTEEEKEYLSNVIKPFRDRIEYIKKLDYLITDEQFIRIQLFGAHFSLPLFKENKYYKNMEAYKKYTLEELGL